MTWKITSYLLQTAVGSFSAAHALRQFLASAERYGHTPMEHANYFNKLQASETKLHLRIFRERKKLRELIQKYAIVQDNLEFFLSEDGILRRIKNNKIRTIESELQIKELKKDFLLSQQGKSIYPYESKQVKRIIDCSRV